MSPKKTVTSPQTDTTGKPKATAPTSASTPPLQSKTPKTNPSSPTTLSPASSNANAKAQLQTGIPQAILNVPHKRPNSATLNETMKRNKGQDNDDDNTTQTNNKDVDTKVWTIELPRQGVGADLDP